MISRCAFCFLAPPHVKYLIGNRDNPRLLICDVCVAQFARQLEEQREADYQRLKEFAP